MAREYIVRPIAWLVAPSDDVSIFGEQSYKVAIDNEGAGEYVTITSHENAHRNNTIAVDPAHWPAIASAVTKAMNQIERHQEHEDE